MITNLEQRSGLTITICTTEDCNLRCKYCYEINKRKRDIPLAYAKRFLDIMINEDSDPILAGEASEGESYVKEAYARGLTLDFIGGDSLMNVDILDDIIKYMIYLLNTSNSPRALLWRDNWRVSISSNGTLFGNPKVREFCEKYKDVLSLGVSIDGSPEIHDLNRIYPDGSGSIKTILEWWPWYQKTFPESSCQTKATASRASIPYLYDSLVFMHETLGLNYINHNFIMEDTGLTEEDLAELNRQMEKCMKYVLEHRNTLFWGMLGYTQFAQHHLSSGPSWNEQGYCGSGSMPAVGVDGNIYPCFRFLPHTQTDVDGAMKVGDVFKGLYNKENFKNVRSGAYRCNCTRDPKCRTCEYESACAYCIGGCFSEFGEFRRTTYICEITKTLCEWSKIYWNKYNELEEKGV